MDPQAIASVIDVTTISAPAIGGALVLNAIWDIAMVNGARVLSWPEQIGLAAVLAWLAHLVL